SWRYPRQSWQHRPGAPCRLEPGCYGSNCGGGCATMDRTTGKRTWPVAMRQKRSAPNPKIRLCAGMPKTSTTDSCARQGKASSASVGREAGAGFVSPVPARGTPPQPGVLKKGKGKLSAYPPRRGGRKKQNPVPAIGTPRTYHRDIRKAGNQGSVCTYHRDIDGAPRCPHHRDISRLPYPAPAGGGIQGVPLQGSSTVRAPVQAGDAGSSPAPVAS